MPYRPHRYKSNLYKSGCLILLLPFLLLGLLGCAGAGGESNRESTDISSVDVWHDDERKVTCWIYASFYKGGISCIPDDQLVTE